ncbi:Hypothetical protein A7982_03327 [Minicystis rosea]|nr:Hypothetical protein A7982_03327 [Minicystis rosea]
MKKGSVIRHHVSKIGRGTGAIAASFALTLSAGCVAGPETREDDAVDTASAAFTLADLEASFTSSCGGSLPAGYSNGTCVVSGFTRTAVDAPNAIYEYAVDVQVGPGAHDVIGLHRVVKEISPYQPAASSTAVMLVHGDAWPFRGAFLDTAQGNTFSAFLANNGVDVWGIDLRWTRVPAATADLSFMASWGMAKDAQDLGVALSIARTNRGKTGSNQLPLKLLGWSRGGQLGYAFLAQETTIPAAQRHVNGFIPVDIYLKPDLSTTEGVRERDAACARLAADRAQYADSTRADRYYANTGVLIATLGQLGQIDPTGASPIVAGLNNQQAALLAGSQTFALQGGLPPTPYYHWVGGTFDGFGLPTGVAYVSSTARWLAAESQAAPYQPVQLLIDAEAATCGDPASTIDAHLSSIAVPILYVGARGGFGDSGLYTTTLLASADVSSLVVSLTPDQLHDIGHSDVFLAQNAPSLFWNGILGWLKSPSPHCQEDKECTLLRDEETCSCVAAPVGSTLPPSNAVCIADPCRGVTAACRNFTCVGISGEEM